MHNVNSPRTDDDALEQVIKAKGLTAPRVTKEEFDANIVDIEIVKHVSKSGQVLRWAVLTTKNGFAVTGNPSASVSSENDDAEIGVAVATANAKNALWPLMGYELRSRLAAVPETKRYSDGTEATGRGPLPDLSPAQQDIASATPEGFECYIGTKQIYACSMTRGDYNAYRGWAVPAGENPADEGYLIEYTDGGKPNDSRHDGYISWSPRDVFERAYRVV